MRPRRSDRDLYRSLAAETELLANGQALICSPLTDDPFIVPESIVRLLDRCRRPASLRGHAQAVATELSLPSEGHRELLTTLGWLVENGFLVSERTVLGILRRSGTARQRCPAPRIEVIGIPTADRPRLLDRALQSYLRNLHSHGRSASFVVIDDSRSARNQAANRAVVESTASRGQAVFYLGLEERRRLAHEMAARTGIAQQCLEFALAPDAKYERTTGAARNTLLLLTAGRLSLQVDDDTLAQTALFPPEGADRILRLAPTSLGDPRFGRWTQLQTLLRDETHVDLLSAHEELLGRRIAECLADTSFAQTRIEGVDRRFLRPARDGRATVRMTACGVAGDPGASSSAGTLLQASGRMRSELLREVGVYRAAVHGRRLISAAQYHAVLLTPRCMAMHIGLDGRSVLPPFMPVLRGQDNVFGALLHAADGYVGVLPGAVLHLPTDRRAARAPIGRSGLFHANLHVVRLLQSMPSFSALSMEATLRAAAAHLRLVHGLEREGFEDLLRRLARAAAARVAQRAEVVLGQAQGGAAGKLHAKDLQYILREAHRAMRLKRVRVIDLPGRSFGRASSAVQGLVLAFAELLAVWPEVVSAAREIDISSFVVRGQRPVRCSSRR